MKNQGGLQQFSGPSFARSGKFLVFFPVRLADEETWSRKTPLKWPLREKEAVTQQLRGAIEHPGQSTDVICVSTTRVHMDSMWSAKTLMPILFYMHYESQFEAIRFTCINIKQSFISCGTYPPNNHTRCLRLSLAWHTREQQTQSTYKGYIIPTPSSSSTAHPPLFLCQATT